MSDDEPFLTRWSRRKVEAREQPTAVPDAPAGIQLIPHSEAVVETTENAEPRKGADDLAPALPSLDSLRGLQSDYREFLKPDVDIGTQRAALKKLFSDPHFNQMDGLDVYIDDYGKFEPMSAAVSASLAANKYLRVVDHLLSEDPAKKAEARAREATDSNLPTAPIAHEERAEEVAAPAPTDPAIATPATIEAREADGTVADGAGEAPSPTS
ncbi:MAG: DUF3306 domain-containing protein [Burkholderiales bacterium]